MISVAKNFDTIVMLDQPRSQWSHWKVFQATLKTMIHLEKQAKNVVFRDNDNVSAILYWMDLVYSKNKSFCIYPWINLKNDGNDLKLCGRDMSKVTTVENFQDWQTDPNYRAIRQDMLAGKLLPEHCAVCYQYESLGMESYRQFETIDWITQLDLKDISDLDSISHPRYYEVHTGNNCNIKCRGCQPAFSEPIAKEIRKFKITVPKHFQFYSDYYPIDRIDIDRLDAKSSVYFQGGEPSIMPEIREFMRRCIERKRTDFFLTMCTNGVKFSAEFLDLLNHFSNTNLSFSIDGYDRVNDYWRWGSQWNRVIENAHLVQSLGHSVSINTVPGIYNVTNMHHLLEFLDKEFPFTAIYMQVNYVPSQSAYNHPLKDLVIDSMKRCQETSIYLSNGKSCKTSIDSILAHYENDPKCDLKKLREFFDYNDQLDRVRGSKLMDYIPELEQARSFV
jgi:MoaA/NifB/PqqE/SkfB family radical SAM enzyme